jgi:hypothetical protein
MTAEAKDYLRKNRYDDTQGWVSKDHCNPIDMEDMAELLEAYHQERSRAAIHASASAVFFDDGSDHLRYHYEVLEALTGTKGDDITEEYVEQLYDKTLES